MGEALGKRVVLLAAQLGSDRVFECDLSVVGVVQVVLEPNVKIPHQPPEPPTASGVNAVIAGPVKTLEASASAQRDDRDVGAAWLYLLSDLATGRGQVHQGRRRLPHGRHEAERRAGYCARPTE
jgi:enoyl-[acyl-carrier-protein] reductase (NADH)